MKSWGCWANVTHEVCSWGLTLQVSAPEGLQVVTPVCTCTPPHPILCHEKLVLKFGSSLCTRLPGSRFGLETLGLPGRLSTEVRGLLGRHCNRQQ